MVMEILDFHTSSRKIHTSIQRVQRIPVGCDLRTGQPFRCVKRAYCTYSRRNCFELCVELARQTPNAQPTMTRTRHDERAKHLQQHWAESSRGLQEEKALYSRVRTCPRARRSLVPPETKCIDRITTKPSFATSFSRRPPRNRVYFPTPLFEAKTSVMASSFLPKRIPEPIALLMNWYTHPRFSSTRCRAPGKPPTVSQKRTTTMPRVRRPFGSNTPKQTNGSGPTIPDTLSPRRPF